MIYFIQVGDDGPIKIGKADSVPRRFKSLSSSHYGRLRLLGVMEGGFSQEEELHNRFVRHLIRGEWFKPEPPLIDFISALPCVPEDIASKCVMKDLPHASLARIVRPSGDYETFHLGPVEVEEAISRLQPGDVLPVVTLGRLAPNRQQLRVYVSEIIKRKAIIFETKTGRRLDNIKDIFEAVLDAVEELAQDRRTHSPDAAKRFGKLGGRPAQDRISKDEAERVWFDARIKTVPEALDRMPGWTQRSAYREFGPRGVTVGRPRGPSKD